MKRIQVTIDQDGYELLREKGNGVFINGLRLAIQIAKRLLKANIQLTDIDRTIKRHRHCILIDDGAAAFLKELGDNNLSRGIRKCAIAARMVN